MFGRRKQPLRPPVTPSTTPAVDQLSLLAEEVGNIAREIQQTVEILKQERMGPPHRRATDPSTNGGTH